SGGSIAFNAHDLLAVSPSAVANLGISRTFQNLELCRNLSAVENVMLGLYHRVKAPAVTFALSLPVARRAEATARTRALELLELVECAHVAATPVRALPYGLQKRVELARALACDGD